MSADFMAGVTACGFAVIAAFFARFWIRTRDNLFAAFSLAFLLLAANQAIPSILRLSPDARSPVYLLRAAAFFVIICAVLGKNLAGGGRRSQE